MADRALRAARANRIAAYVDAVPVLAKHQIEEVHEDPTGHLIVVCHCGHHIDYLGWLGSRPIRIASRDDARAALAEHQVDTLRGRP